MQRDNAASDLSWLAIFVESCREFGHAALRNGDDPFDVLDRQMDNVQGRITSLIDKEAETNG